KPECREPSARKPGVARRHGGHRIEVPLKVWGERVGDAVEALVRWIGAEADVIARRSLRPRPRCLHAHAGDLLYVRREMRIHDGQRISARSGHPLPKRAEAE